MSQAIIRYKQTSRCRLCNMLVEGPIITGTLYSVHEHVHREYYQRNDVMKTHRCDNGSIGVLDLIGIVNITIRHKEQKPNES